MYRFSVWHLFSFFSTHVRGGRPRGILYAGGQSQKKMMHAWTFGLTRGGVYYNLIEKTVRKRGNRQIRSIKIKYYRSVLYRCTYTYTVPHHRSSRSTSHSRRPISIPRGGHGYLCDSDFCRQRTIIKIIR